jgi:hypothetical protein
VDGLTTDRRSEPCTSWADICTVFHSHSSSSLISPPSRLPIQQETADACPLAAAVSVCNSFQYSAVEMLESSGAMGKFYRSVRKHV